MWQKNPAPQGSATSGAVACAGRSLRSSPSHGRRPVLNGSSPRSPRRPRWSPPPPITSPSRSASSPSGRGGLAPPFSEYASMIEAASDQLGELIDELSLVARIESERYDPKLESVGVGELAASAVERLGEDRVSVSGAGGEVTVDVEA